MGRQRDSAEVSSFGLMVSGPGAPWVITPVALLGTLRVHVLLHCSLQALSTGSMRTVCKCDKCSLYQYKAIDGSYKRGRAISAAIARAHKQETLMRQKVQNKARHDRDQNTRRSQSTDQSSQAIVENAIFLAAFQNERSQELPVRGRDVDTPYDRSTVPNVSAFVPWFT